MSQLSDSRFIQSNFQAGLHLIVFCLLGLPLLAWTPAIIQTLIIISQSKANLDLHF